MKIGITFYADQTLWLCESNQTAFMLAELFAILHHDVILLHSCPSIVQYEYMPSYCTISEQSAVSHLDWLIDMDGHMSTDLRKKVATRTIVFLRTCLSFEEMNASVYPDYPYQARHLKDVYEIWCWDILNPEETIPCIQVLFPCPIRRVPYIWSPSIIESISVHFKANYKKDEPWIIHVSEENNNTSSIIIPMCGIRELVVNHKIPASYCIHNAEMVKENRFFKENIFMNVEADSFPLCWKNEVDWSMWNQNSILLSHVRFIPLRSSLLHFLWLGIPVIHNSSFLATLHPLLRTLYYTENHIQELCNAVTTFIGNSEPWYHAHQEMKDILLTRFGLSSNQSSWKQIIDSLPIKDIPTIIHSGIITIAFANMWEGFHYDSNFIMDALRHFSTFTIKGIPYSEQCQASLVICGPHGSSVMIPSYIPKVYWSAENWPLPHDTSFSLYLTNSMEENDTHIRIPTWMIFIDWFTKETSLPIHCTDNPIRFPLSMAIQSHPTPFHDRKHFCAFVVSNPVCNIRNEAFHYVNNYKKVDSGGALYNNIGGQLALKYPGGGCGDVSKYEFFSTHQFTLSFENSQSLGYITEKVLHAKMAGCVPLYWGSERTDMDFVPHSFINLSAISSAESVVEVIKKLESRPDLCEKIASTPILDEVRKQTALTTIRQMSEQLLKLACNVPLPQITPNTLNCISKTFVVNLESRPDRWDSLEPTVQTLATRVKAVYGKTLKLTRAIYKRYKNNPFQWKKAIIGCYMSHIQIWKQIVEQETGDYFLVLEDDVRFVCGWIEQWNQAAVCLPADAELLYLGGVLPPNQYGLLTALYPVNQSWASIRPNTLFTKDPMSYFHFCTYSYVISKAGAKKLLEFMDNIEGMPYAGVDHLLGRASLQTYVSTPLLAKCAQEEDPMYVHSQFNDLHRNAGFDSDIWNSHDCFTMDDLAPFFDESGLTLYYMSTDSKEFELYERTWLQDMFQCNIECKPFVSMEEAEDDAWFLVQRPYSAVWKSIFADSTKPFKVLHLSDEVGEDLKMFAKTLPIVEEIEADCISFYTNPLCKGVIRNYKRADVPDLPHIITIPLGYHYRHDGPIQSMSTRKWVWSFHGTNWHDRSQQLEAFQKYGPYNCHLQPGWNDPSGTKKEDYLSFLGNSQFCPILRGNHVETFRLYEALEAGVLPLFGPSISHDFMEGVKKYINVSAIYDWCDLECMNLQMEQKEKAQFAVLSGWTQWKIDIQKACRTLIKNS